VPMWKPVDSAELEGHEPNEDLFGEEGNLAWILDGASAVSSERVTTEQPTDAHWLVHRLNKNFTRLADSRSSLQDLVAEAIAMTAGHAAHEWSGTAEVAPSAALGVVRHAGDHVEFLVLADVSVILLTPVGSLELSDLRVERCNEPAKRVMTGLLDAGASFDGAYEGTRPHLAAVRRAAMNRVDGYWVASTDETAAAHALVGTMANVNEVILATDGFMRGLHLFRLVPDADALFDTNFGRLVEQIREAERADPETRKFPRWNVHDDICAHRLRWVD